jgi:hypothetical protein
VGALGCGARAPRSPVVALPRCDAIPAPAEPADSLLVGITATVDPARLFTRANIAERFVGAHAYETLIRVDCAGQTRPGLAVSWTQSPNGITLVLRRGATFWSGTPVRSGDIIEGWRATAGGDVMTVVSAGASAPDDSTLVLNVGGMSLEDFASPATAVRRARPGARWPEGTGTYRVDDSSGPAVAPSGVLRLISVRAGEPRLTILARSEDAGRDLVDHGVDLLLTESAAVSRYARAGSALTPLGARWTRSWLLATPPRTDPAVATTPRARPSYSTMMALARDAAPGVMRPAGRALVDHAEFCWRADAPRSFPASRQGRARVVYRADDAVGRALAGRLVAIAQMQRTGRGDSLGTLLGDELRDVAVELTTAGLAQPEFEAALRAGSEVAYLLQIGLPRHHCDLHGLLTRAPWLLAGEGPGRTLSPLVDGASATFVRPDRAGVMLTGDGTPVVIGSAKGREVPR